VEGGGLGAVGCGVEGWGLRVEGWGSGFRVYHPLQPGIRPDHRLYRHPTPLPPTHLHLKHERRRITLTCFCLPPQVLFFYFFFFFTLVTGPRRPLSRKLSDTRVYEPHIRARLGTTAYFCEVAISHKSP